MARPKVTRMRSLTPAQERRLASLRNMSRLLDSAFEVPGTSWRIGLDPIAGLIPGIGDLVTPLFTAAVLVQAWQLGVPKVVQARMLVNVALDSLLGVVPFFGDLFDFAWKANDLNMALLERHAYEERPAAPGDWAFVTLMLALVLALAVVPFLLLGWLLSAVRGVF
jgi:hypothetical protein